MKRSLLRVLPGFFAIFFFTACATEMIHEVDKVNYGYYSKTPLTMEQIRPAIERTALRNGWQVSNQRDGSFIGKRAWGGGKHNIVVAVIYDVQAFSIKYRDSYQMKYDGSWIHNTYNRMVQKLEDDIIAAVTAL